MIKLGLIGYPLGHSLSPRIHNTALDACGLEGNYSLFPVQPDDQQALENLLNRVRYGEIHGLNVTIPHKQNVIPALDGLTPTAKSIGAVNTIYLHKDKLIGENTDARGFLVDLQKLLTTHLSWRTASGETRRQGDLRALVLGAGGSARAIVYALVHAGWDVMIAARRLDQGNQLANQFENVMAIELSPQTFQRSDVQLIVNTTPVGMRPIVDESLWPEDQPFPVHAAIYDLVYNPRETKLVQEARAQGLEATTGLGMLIEQAALAFEIWTGYNPPREIMLEAVNQTVD